jgi:predicted alpha/beta superfamily hydrolase
VFTRIAVVSPAVFWADNQIVRYTEEQTRKPPLRIWLDIGTKEGRDAKEAQATVDGARLLEKTLIRKGWNEGKDLTYFEAEGAEHNEKAWAARIDQILEFLFPRQM